MVADELRSQPILGSQTRFTGLRWGIRTDEVQLADDQVVVRDILIHSGAVGIVALDDQDRVLLNRQYRHPVGAYMWEPPAGLMDVIDEDPLACAQREFVEEAGLVAQDWHVLFDFCNTPGGSTEAFRCYLARGISEAPGGRPERGEEEAMLEPRWVPLAEAVGLVQSGQLNNPTAVTGIMAAQLARNTGFSSLRQANAPWPMRDHLVANDRVWQS